MEERFKHADRWHGAIRDWQKPLSLAWGMLDPVATEAVLDAVLALRPAAPVTRFEDLGHYPQIEDPGRVAVRSAGRPGRLSEPLDHAEYRRYTVALRPDPRDFDHVGAGSFFAV